MDMVLSHDADNQAFPKSVDDLEAVNNKGRRSSVIQFLTCSGAHELFSREVRAWLFRN